MKEYKHGRSRKQQKIDRDQAYDDGERHVSAKARQWFRAKPYGCVRKGSETNGGEDNKN